MGKDRKRKERPNVTIDQYLNWCQDEISLKEYFEFEKKRVITTFKTKIDPSKWIEIIEKQSIKCYYCKTELLLIQQLILNKIINPRKRGPDGYSGLHFELDHKAAGKENKIENLVACCYYCNNDKSNTFSSDIFKDYFGLYKNEAFNRLFKDYMLVKTEKFRHHLKGKKQEHDLFPLKGQ